MHQLVSTWASHPITRASWLSRYRTHQVGKWLGQFGIQPVTQADLQVELAHLKVNLSNSSDSESYKFWNYV